MKRVYYLYRHYKVLNEYLKSESAKNLLVVSSSYKVVIL